MKRLALTLVLLAAACAGARGQETAGQAAAEKRQDIRRLLQLNGSGQAGVQVFEQMLPNMSELFRAMFDTMPAQTRERAVRIMEEEGRKGFTAERMVEELVPIYDKYFTAEEIKSLIAFYESPVGKKLVASQPSIITEAGAVGEKIGNEVVEKILRRYQEEGVTPPRTGQPERKAPPRRRTR
jgi:uncharacterized protein